MRRRATGFSMIDVVVGVALMLVIFLSLFGVLRASLVLSSLTKAKTAGVEIANTQMEYLRGLAYDSLGTVGGIPGGSIPQFATSTVDGMTYVTRTYIQYQDDPADGAGGSDTNHITTDYKVAKITVTYSIYAMTKSITLVSNFVPASIESSNGGGTLSLHIVDAVGGDVGNATVQIINASTSPAINLTTFSDSSGLVLIGGAATSSQYQIFVSKSGYSSDQTYARTAQNVNPNPGYLTVTKNLTTSGTFGIDLLATPTFTSFSSATTTTFSDTFTSSANLINQIDTQVSGGALSLSDDLFSGSALSIPIIPNYLSGWGILSATFAKPVTTTAVVHVADTTGTLIPDADLSGNSTGFSTFPVSLTGISTTTYPGLTLKVDLTRVATSSTVSLLDWSLSHTDGPAPIPNITFTLTGAKSKGTDGSSQPIPKNISTDTTNASGTKTLTIEWDAYTLSTTNLIEACPNSPIAITPSQASTTTMIVGTLGTHTLPLVILTTGSTSVPYAKVVLTKSGYAATISTSECGLAYFNGIPSGTYTATVSASGHTTKAFTNITVLGHASSTALFLP